MNKEQLIQNILNLLGSARFNRWYNEGGRFDQWIQGMDKCPTTEEIKKDIEEMFKLK